MKTFSSLLCLIILFSAIGCKQEDLRQETGTYQEVVTKNLPQKTGCIFCHWNEETDQLHNFACTVCHQGNNDTNELPLAHENLIDKPAHPDVLQKTCGKCHNQIVTACMKSLHFTLKKEVNLIRNGFGAGRDLDSLLEVPAPEVMATKLDLADDMVRRRCLRCHLYSPGDRYPATYRGTGCAACHMQFKNNSLESHAIFKTPIDYQCLGCHYGNHVGADYYGMYEQDFNREYRTPYTTQPPDDRPYGVETHKLAPDVHQQRGLHCVDCHSGRELMTGDAAASPHCANCHNYKDTAANPFADTLSSDGNTVLLRGKHGNQSYIVPQLTDVLHDFYKNSVDCQVCHAQWSFNDSPTYLLRSDLDEFSPWERLSVQSAREIEQLLENNNDFEKEELPAVMRDGISGEGKNGIWYMGYGQRRWEHLAIRRDTDGKLKVFRPILDLSLSAIDKNGKVLFDNIESQGQKWLPYTPHTTGAAGLFYRYRLPDNVRQKESSAGAGQP